MKKLWLLTVLLIFPAMISNGQGLDDLKLKRTSISSGQGVVASGLDFSFRMATPDSKFSIRGRGNSTRFFGITSWALTSPDTPGMAKVEMSAGAFSGIPWAGPLFRFGYGPISNLSWIGGSLGVEEFQVDSFDLAFWQNTTSVSAGRFSFSYTVLYFALVPPKEVQHIISGNLGIPINSHFRAFTGVTFDTSDFGTPLLKAGISFSP